MKINNNNNEINKIMLEVSNLNKQGLNQNNDFKNVNMNECIDKKLINFNNFTAINFICNKINRKVIL